MPKTCPKCGLSYPDAFKFCKEDGAELVPEPETPALESGQVVSEPAVKRPAAFMAELPDPEELEAPDGPGVGGGRTAIPVAVAVLLILVVGGFLIKSNQKAISKPSATVAPDKAATAGASAPLSAQKTTEAPAPTPTPQPARAAQSGLEGEQFPQTKDHRLGEAEISSWSYAKVRYAINEIYARHGYAFQNPAIRKQFSQFAWYRPASGLSMEQIEQGRLSKVEFENAKLLAARRKQLEAQGAR